MLDKKALNWFRDNDTLVQQESYVRFFWRFCTMGRNFVKEHSKKIINLIRTKTQVISTNIFHFN